MSDLRHMDGAVSEKITSLQNGRVKAIRALDMRKTRRETGLFVAEGASVLLSARDAGWSLETLVYLADRQQDPGLQTLLGWARDSGAECLSVSATVLGKLAAKDNPQSVLGVFKQRWSALPAPPSVAADETWLVLEEVRDPGNLGTIIRTSDAVSVSGVVLVGNCCDPYSREALRATMGSVFAVPLVRADVSDFLAWRESWPGDVVGLHLHGGEDFRSATYAAPQMIVMGSEGPGLSQAVSDACSKRVKIPMSGRLDSLNLAVATALTLYQVRGPYLNVS
ncbi:MAG: RNA methyltransferase [Pseudomonadota bacterium]